MQFDSRAVTADEHYGSPVTQCTSYIKIKKSRLSSKNQIEYDSMKLNPPLVNNNKWSFRIHNNTTRLFCFDNYSPHVVCTSQCSLIRDSRAVTADEH